MTKKELVAKAASKTNLTQTQATAALDAILSTIGEAMNANEKVTIPSFGTFEAKTRQARNCINPKTKETVLVPTRIVKTFKASKLL